MKTKIRALFTSTVLFGLSAITAAQSPSDPPPPSPETTAAGMPYLKRQLAAHEPALAGQSAYAEFGDKPPRRAAARAATPIIIWHLERAPALQATRLPAQQELPS